MSKTYASKKELDEGEFDLNSLVVPDYVSHVKPGTTLFSSENILIIQDGPTTLEIRALPKFEQKRVPWHNGLIRDIAWCPELNAFVLLTQKGLFTFNPKSIVAPSITTVNNDIQLKIVAYSKIKPYDDNHSFWRCTCVGTALYICYSGFGTTVDEYEMEKSSCKFVNRWSPPKTCAHHEGIWCIRSHPNTDQLGVTIMDGQTNQWRFEIRSRTNLSTIWRTVLPIAHGDCEISPLANGEWLAINSCGVRLIQIGHRKIEAAVEYERELKNAIKIGNDYLIVRTKNTLEIHSLKKKKT